MTDLTSGSPGSGSVVPLRPAVPSRLVDRYADRIRQARAGLVKIPPAELTEIDAAIRQALVPATTKERQAAVAALLGAYRKPDLENPEIFVLSVLEDLSEYPADILVAMVYEIRRTSKFFPAIAECREVCDRLVRPRRILEQEVDEILGRPFKAIPPPRGSLAGDPLL